MSDLHLIKVKKVEPLKIAGYKFTAIKGEYPDGKEFSNKIFANDKDLNNSIDVIGIGEIALITTVKKGKYDNITNIEIGSEKDFKKAESEASANDTSGDSNKSFDRSAGLRGADTNRSAALYLAKDVVMANNDGRCPKEKLFAVAEMIKHYIEDGAVPNFGMSTMEDASDDDGMEPPKSAKKTRTKKGK